MIESMVQLCNLALIKLGHNTILSLNDNEKPAIILNIIHKQVIDEVLRSHDWSCAKERQSLARIDEDVVGYDFANQFQLPVSPYCLRVLRMLDVEADYLVVGRRLLTNESTCKIEYIKRIVDPTEFDSLLVEAIAARLAHYLSYSLSASLEMKAQLYLEYERILMRAKAMSSIESAPQYEDRSWIEVGR